MSWRTPLSGPSPDWNTGSMLRFLTAGESHGRALVATIDGLPAHIRVSTDDLRRALARRRLGVGRGARMKFEADAVTMLAGMRHGETLGSPIAVMIDNTEWPKWEQVMAPDEVDPSILATLARNEKLTRPRPGHVDLAGMQKYDWDEARPLLERASARETAARVVLGEFAKQFLAQAYGITVLSHVVAIGGVRAQSAEPPRMADLATIDDDPVRCLDPEASKDMQAAIEECRKAGDTLGGVVEVLAWGCPPGLGSMREGDTRLDGQLAGALMGIQAIKGVEIGDGFELASVRGSQAHDEIAPGPHGIRRLSARSGGTEGGISTGEVLRARAAMKPIATIPRALQTLDVATGKPATAHNQRSDVCAVPAAGVVTEAVMALTVAQACLDKFGGDSLEETRRNHQAYLKQVRDRGLGVADQR